MADPSSILSPPVIHVHSLRHPLSLVLPFALSHSLPHPRSRSATHPSSLAVPSIPMALLSSARVNRWQSDRIVDAGYPHLLVVEKVRARACAWGVCARTWLTQPPSRSARERVHAVVPGAVGAGVVIGRGDVDAARAGMIVVVGARVVVLDGRLQGGAAAVHWGWQLVMAAPVPAQLHVPVVPHPSAVPGSGSHGQQLEQHQAQAGLSQLQPLAHPMKVLPIG
jgi:hypothetical protein